MCIYICLCLEIIDRIEEYICMYIYRRICTCSYYMYIASEQRMHLGSQFNFFPAGPVHVDGVLSLFSIFFFFFLILTFFLFGKGVTENVQNILCNYFGHSSFLWLLLCFPRLLASRIQIKT